MYLLSTQLRHIIYDLLLKLLRPGVVLCTSLLCIHHLSILHHLEIIFDELNFWGGTLVNISSLASWSWLLILLLQSSCFFASLKINYYLKIFQKKITGCSILFFSHFSIQTFGLVFLWNFHSINFHLYEFECDWPDLCKLLTKVRTDQSTKSFVTFKMPQWFRIENKMFKIPLCILVIY